MSDKQADKNAYTKLTPQEKKAVDWHVGLLQKREASSGNTFAITNKDEYMANARAGIINNNPEGLRNIVEMFSDPKCKAQHEAAMAGKHPSFPSFEEGDTPKHPMVPHDITKRSRTYDI